MGKEKPAEVEFSLTEIETTEESIEKIENEQEKADFLSGEEMAKAYIDAGIMRSLGKMTKEDMEKLAANDKKIVAELIPKQLRDNDEKEGYAIYKILEERDPDSPIEKKIKDDEIERQRKIQEKTKEGYELLVKKERMKRLKITTKEDVENYKKQNNIPNENIKEVLCFDEDGNTTKESRLYYEIIN